MAHWADWKWMATEIAEVDLQSQMQSAGLRVDCAAVVANAIAVGRAWQVRRAERWGRTEEDGRGWDFRDLQSLRALRAICAANCGAARTTDWVALVNLAMDQAERIIAAFPPDRE